MRHMALTTQTYGTVGHLVTVC